MNMNWQHFRDFLRGLGVEMEESGTQAFPTLSSEPRFTLLQHSRDHEAFYRVDLTDTEPDLMVLIPTHDNPLRFHIYLVQQSSTNHLFGSLERWAANQQKSEALGQAHEAVEWHTLQAMIETMKTLFWAGLETGQFPHEIVVYKIL